MDFLIDVILYLVLTFCPFIGYFCFKTKQRAWLSFIVIVFIIDIVVMAFYFN